MHANWNGNAVRCGRSIGSNGREAGEETDRSRRRFRMEYEA